MKNKIIKQTSFSKEDIINEIKAKTDLGMEFLETELDYFDSLLNENEK